MLDDRAGVARAPFLEASDPLSRGSVFGRKALRMHGVQDSIVFQSFASLAVISLCTRNEPGSPGTFDDLSQKIVFVHGTPRVFQEG